MTMEYKIMIGSVLTPDQSKQIQQLIHLTFSEIDQTCNKWNENSELSLLNHAPPEVKFPLSHHLQHLFHMTELIVAISENRFDPTIEPLQRVWKKHLENGEIPPDETLTEIIPSIGWNHIHVRENLFYKDHSRTELDLGGIAKGYTVDLLTERLNATGFQDVYVEWGGEIRASGKHPDNRPWTIFISRFGDPDPNHAIATVPLTNQSIATSGNYFQSWTVGEYTYSHIINPSTLSPLIETHEGVAGASVIAPSCAIADALATAVMLFPTIEQAREWADKIEQADPTIHFYLSSSE